MQTNKTTGFAYFYVFKIFEQIHIVGSCFCTLLQKVSTLFSVYAIHPFCFVIKPYNDIDTIGLFSITYCHSKNIEIV